jgi:predicted transposase/invertase (TIGR01784 family)
VEISQVLSSRLDLLGATADDSLVHIELQSTNDPEMALRMAEYSLRIYRQFKKFPR